jgi:hypothetical protein
MNRRGGVRRWHLWALWLLSLAACPAGLLVVWLSYPDVAPHPPPWPPDPPPQHLAENLLNAHALVSLAAAAAVPLLARRWTRRAAAWAGVAGWLGATALLTLCVVIAKTGKYL